LRYISTAMVILILVLIIIIVLLSIRTIMVYPPRLRSDKPLASVERIFFLNLSSDGSRMTIELILGIKNEGDKPVYITRIEVPELGWVMPLENVYLEPGATWTKRFIVAQNIPYTKEWEKGTRHIVVVYYRVEGQTKESSISFNAIVANPIENRSR